MDEEAHFEAQMITERMRQLREKVKQTEAQIEAVCRRFTWYHLLLTIPGFGPFVASTVLSCIGDPHRFDGRESVIRLAGLDLNAKRSGCDQQTRQHGPALCAVPGFDDSNRFRQPLPGTVHTVLERS